MDSCVLPPVDVELQLTLSVQQRLTQDVNKEPFCVQWKRHLTPVMVEEMMTGLYCCSELILDQSGDILYFSNRRQIS